MAATLVALLVVGGHDEPAFATDLAGLRSIDDLYTAPQIRQQSGYSLEATAFSRAGLRVLREDPPALAPATRTRLAAQPGARPAREALATALLGPDGVKAPTRAELHTLWRRALASRDDTIALLSLADLADASASSAGAGRAPGSGDARVRALLRRTATSADFAVLRARARVVRALGLRPDAPMRRTGERGALRATTNADRVIEAAAIVESAAAAGVRPGVAVVDALIDAASQLDDPALIWVALGALRAAARPARALRDRAVILRRGLGTRGAVREIAVFETIPKAVWLTAHLRLAAGADSLPDDDTVALSKAIARRDALTDDADDRALLLASARLAGLEYDDAALSRAPVPAATIASTQQAIAWAQRAQVASDLGARPVSVAVAPWGLKDDVDVAAVGLVLAVAPALGTRTALAPGTIEAFRRAAATTTFRSSRWAAWAAAGLAATRSANAGGPLRGVRVGCPGFPHLVADAGGTCDLEATWFVLRLAKSGVPAAKRLRGRIVGEAA